MVAGLALALASAACLRGPRWRRRGHERCWPRHRLKRTTAASMGMGAAPCARPRRGAPRFLLAPPSVAAGLLRLFLCLRLLLTGTDAFSSLGGNSNTALLSRLATVQAELLLSVGRIPGTAMPPEWAASGAKLGFSLEVEFTDERCEYEMTKERLLKGDALMGTTLMAVEPLNEPRFVSAKGEEVIRVEPGAYGCQIQDLESRRYALRFFLDFPEGAKRNDVELPAERAYFLASCWLLSEDDAALGRARGRKERLAESLKQIQRDLEGSEREAGLFRKVAAFRRSVDLVEQRGKLASQLDALEQGYPLDSAKAVRGPNDVVFAREGVLAVKRLRGALGTREQYHWVGTFEINRFFEDEEEDC